jgi:hypothetical protein
MTAGLAAISGRWSGSAAMYQWLLICLAVVPAVFAAGSTVVAHEKQGFVVLPNQA